MKNIFDYRIERIHSIISPQEMLNKIPASDDIHSFIYDSRKEISAIINGKCNKFLLLVGPCSIHDPVVALEYAERISMLRKKYENTFYIVMRSYFEKPRTVSGWRGLLVEPDLNGFINIAGGLERARKFLINLAELRVPAAVEVLDPIVPQYLADLVSWASIGARSAESQMHRELASGLSMPVGFKNATNGELAPAINGIRASRLPHAFVGIARNGLSAIIHTTGNGDSHLILRGGANKLNCDRTSIEYAEQILKSENLKANILIDCSHGNSQKNPKMQKQILLDTIKMRFDKTASLKILRGCMLESFLQEGSCSIQNCNLPENYGRSITDPCMSWQMTEDAIAEANDLLSYHTN